MLKLQWGGKMRVDFNAGEQLFSIEQELRRLPELAEQEEKKVMKRIQKIITEKLKANLPKSAGQNTNYDGSKPYVHMQDDIKATVKSKDGVAYVLIRGGKLTGFKWHLVNDGTRDRNGGVKTPATHFIDMALKQSEPEIDALIDELIGGIVDEG